MTVKKITIALLSDDSVEFKRFIVPKYLIVLTLIFGICCAVYVGWLITNYQIVKSKMPILARLQKENEQQRIAFAHLANRIEQMAPKADKSAEPESKANGSHETKAVGNDQKGRIPAMSDSAPDLMPAKYSMGGGEPLEEEKESAQVHSQLAALRGGDGKSLNEGGSTEPVLKPERKESVVPIKMVTYPYSLQIGSYRTQKRADTAISIYRRKGLSPYWVKVDLGESGTWFRVFVGHFRDKTTANDYQQEHRITDGIIKRVTYANLIGIYTVEEQFDDEMIVLEKKGYFPYVIKDEDERFRLFVGGFFTKAGVEKQHAKLFDQGILSEIVKR